MGKLSPHLKQNDGRGMILTLLVNQTSVRRFVATSSRGTCRGRPATEIKTEKSALAASSFKLVKLKAGSIHMIWVAKV